MPARFVRRQPIIVECDEASVSSTVEGCQSMPQHHFIIECSCRQSVCFNESENVAYENTQLSKEDAYNLWYHAADCKKFKSEFATAAVKEVVRIEKENKKNKSSYHNIFERVHHACCTCWDK